MSSTDIADFGAKVQFEDIHGGKNVEADNQNIAACDQRFPRYTANVGCSKSSTTSDDLHDRISSNEEQYDFD